MVSVVRTPAPDGSSALLGPLSMKESDASTFHFEGADFVLTLNALDNALVGDDVAKFSLRAADAKPPALSEAQKIERLIDAVAKLEGATFLRNGDEHSTSDAVEHLRRNANRALQEAKRRGKNQVWLFSGGEAEQQREEPQAL